MPSVRRQIPTARAIACARLVAVLALTGTGGQAAGAAVRPAPVDLGALAPRAAYGIYDSG